MSQLFGFPSGLAGGSKETVYTTSQNTSRTTNYTTNYSTGWTTDHHTTPGLTGNHHQGPFTSEWYIYVVGLQGYGLRVELYGSPMTSLAMSSLSFDGYSSSGSRGKMPCHYATQQGSDWKLVGSPGTPYSLNINSSFGGSGSSADVGYIKSALYDALGRVNSAYHKHAAISYTGGTSSGWNSLPMRNPHGLLGNNNRYLFNFDHYNTVNGQYYKVFSWAEFDVESLHYDNNAYMYKCNCPARGFFRINDGGSGYTTSYTTNKSTSKTTSRTTSYSTSHSTSHITYG